MSAAAAARAKASAKGNARSVHAHAQVAPTDTPWAPALAPSEPRLSRGISGFQNAKRKQSVFRLVKKVSILSNGTVGNAVSPEAANAEANEAAFIERQRIAQLKLAEDKAKHALRFQPHGYVIDPRTASWMQWWDIVMMVALLFTALVTPLEVAFLEGGTVRARCMQISEFRRRGVGRRRAADAMVPVAPLRVPPRSMIHDALHHGHGHVLVLVSPCSMSHAPCPMPHVPCPCPRPCPRSMPALGRRPLHHQPRRRCRLHF